MVEYIPLETDIDYVSRKYQHSRYSRIEYTLIILNFLIHVYHYGKYYYETNR